MDDDSSESLRISQSDTRWSMNSQRLESIVAELLKPIGDIRRSFDTDLSALLEEYLTEAGLRALDEELEAPAAAPNFAELALLLQQSASVYSRKVDFLYQHVLSVSDSLQQSTQEMESATSAAARGEGEAAATPARRKRKASGAPDGFRELTLERDGAARRERSARPPPTLPRTYVELEPRAPSDADAPLLDYAGEPVGLLADFHVAWRLHAGLLVEELPRGAAPAPALRPVPLLELSEAIAAAGPPSPPPPDRRSPSPLASPAAPDPPATPAAPDAPQPDAASTPLAAEARRERKRRSEAAPEDAPGGPLMLTISDATRCKLQRVREFSVPDTWLRRVVRRRARAVLALRRDLRVRDRSEDERGFRGFDASPSDCGPEGGFPGWSGAAGAACATAVLPRRPDDSDDDGFFEQSSFGDSDASRVDDCSPAACGALPEWSSWRARVVARANEAEARGRDVRRAAAALLGACELLPSPAPFPALLARAAERPADVAELFLATLFLANAGNVEIVPGAPLSLDSFGVRLLSADPRRYCAALQPEHEQHA